MKERRPLSEALPAPTGKGEIVVHLSRSGLAALRRDPRRRRLDASRTIRNIGASRKIHVTGMSPLKKKRQ
jgi:hypothetical protein